MFEFNFGQAVSGFAGFAKHTFEIFNEYVKAGFNHEQALFLTNEVIKVLLKNIIQKTEEK